MAGLRPKRLAEQIQREVAAIIDFKVKDPRKGMITITGVNLTNDLSLARIKYTAVDRAGNPDSETAQTVLEHAAGFIKHELAQVLRVRVIPELRFKYDDSMDKIRHIDGLINRIHSEDDRHS